MTANNKSIFFIGTPAGDIAAYYKGPGALDASSRIGAGGEFPLVILSHGFGAAVTMSESARLFVDTAAAFAQAGVGALLFDFIGQGVSDGAFSGMTPMTRIRDLSAVLDWALARHKGPVFLLGLSMGAAVSIHVAAERQKNLAGLVTWSAVPSFDPENPAGQWYLRDTDATRVFAAAPDFSTDRPAHTIGDAYRQLTLPKIQIQGSDDIPHFASEFLKFYDAAPDPKAYVLLEGGDHAFTSKAIRAEVIARSVAWVKDIAGKIL